MQDFSNILSTYYYHKLINIATRERKQSSTLLDNIYTNITNCYETGSSGVLRFVTQSDHYPIFTVRNNVLPSEQIKYITKWIHNQQNIALFRKHLKSMGIYQINPISQLFTIFMDTIQQYFNLSFSLKKTKIRYKNILSTYYYHKLINIATRERKQSSTLLDNIYTNITNCYETGSSGVLRFVTQSDHYPIFTVRNNVLPSEQIKYITKWIHNQQNIALFRKHLKSMGIYQINPISQLFTIFMDTIQQYFNLSFSLKKTKIRYKNRNLWITKELKSDIKIRDKLYKLTKKVTNSRKLK